MNLGLRKSSFFLLSVSLIVWQTPAFGFLQEGDSETPSASDESFEDDPEEAHPADLPEESSDPDENISSASTYVPGELIVKLKEGHDLSELNDLHQRFGVTFSEKISPASLAPQERLEELKKKRAGLESPDHSGWYWWSDKESKEYQEYRERISKEKEDLDHQIQTQEELLHHLKQWQERTPEGVASPSLERTYILGAGESADIPSLAAAYQRHPAVEHAEPNYLAETQ